MFLQIDKTYPFILVSALAILGNSYYYLNKDYNKSQQDLSVANIKIEMMTNQSIKTNKELESNSRKIQGLINANLKVNENLSDAINKSECANIPLPTNAINILRSKAAGANQDTDTSEPNTAEHNTATQ